MKLTTNAVLFASINTISTIGFLTKLNDLVVSKNFDQIAIWAILYGLVWAISGAILGGTDRARGYRGNIDFQYAAITSAVGVASIWLAKLFLPAIMPVSYVTLAMVTLIIVVATAVQHYVSSRSPKGINKHDAFK